MRIVQLANFYGPVSGGLRTAVDALGRGYHAAGHERVLVVPGKRRETHATAAGQVCTLPGIPVSGGYRVMPRASAVLRVLESLAPDSVEVSDKATLVAVGEWARANRVGAVLFSHERLDTWLAARWSWLGRPPLEQAIARWNTRIASRFDTVVVTSDFARQEFAALGVRDVRQVPLGVDLTTFRPVRTAAGDGIVRLVYAGRLSPEKNPGPVIGAVRLLVEVGLPVHLDVYGDGVAREALGRSATGLPVTFHGHLTGRGELAERLARADVAFAPSAAETFGLSVLEALACGTPVVTANTGGAGELVAPSAGVTVPPTAQGLALGVCEVLSWPVATRRRAARARAERFPWSATVAAMLDVHRAQAD